MSDDVSETHLELLRQELLRRLTEIDGNVRLVLFQLDAAREKTADLSRIVEGLAERVTALETGGVTRDELDKRFADVRAQQEDLARRRLTVWGLVLAAVSIVASSGTSTIIAIATQ